MTNTIYFGAYTDEDLDNMGIDKDTAPHVFADTVFEFRADIYPQDMFMRLEDSLGRMVPIDMSHYKDLITVLTRAINLTELQELSYKLQKELDDSPTAIVNHCGCMG